MRPRADDSSRQWGIKMRATWRCSWTLPTKTTPRASWPSAWGFVPVVPPNPQRRQPWALDKALYRRRNEVERLFRRLKAWRRVFTRCDKTDVMFAAFITAALIAETLR